MAYGALQSLVWHFGQTALNSLQFLKETFANTPILRIKAVAYPMQRTRWCALEFGEYHSLGIDNTS